jgi:hypothetical protein
MALISARWAVMAGVSQHGMTRPAPLPAFGQMAPKIWADCVRWSCGAEGRVPRRAQRRVIVFFRPILASAMGLGPMAAFHGELLEPQLYCGARRKRRADFRQPDGEYQRSLIVTFVRLPPRLPAWATNPTNGIGQDWWSGGEAGRGAGQLQ